jgi:hypothetical protein
MILLHIRLPEEIVNIIDNCFEGANTTERVKNYITSGVIGRELMEYELAKCTMRTKYLKDALDKNPFYKIDVLSAEEKVMLKDTVSLKEGKFKNDVSFLNSRKNLYNNRFVKNLTFKEFELLLYKFKESQGV